MVRYRLQTRLSDDLQLSTRTFGLLPGLNHGYREGPAWRFRRSRGTQRAVAIQSKYRNAAALIRHVNKLAGRIGRNAPGLRSGCDGPDVT